jgi:ABC-type transporter Mla subunit MlaD
MTDYNTAQHKRNMMVGGFVIIAFCAFIWMVFIFGELPVAMSRFGTFRVDVKFPNASGVQENTPVKYCGFQVGRVVNMIPPVLRRDREPGQSYHYVKVELAIETGYHIPNNVEVKLLKRGLGSSYIEFQVPLELTGPVKGFLQPNAELEGSTGISSDFFPPEMLEKLKSLVDTVEDFAKNANEIIGDSDNKTNLKQTLANVTLMTAQVTETLKSFKEFSDSGTVALHDIAEKVNDTLIEFQKVLTKANQGDGTAAKLLNDGRLYENLLDSSQELQMALEQLKILAAETREDGIEIKLW